MPVAERVESSAACDHCGTRFRAPLGADRFCCAGCEYVYRMIHDESLERFYDLRGTVARPVGASVFAQADYDWLKPMIEAAERNGPIARLALGMEGVSCVGCVWLVDRLFQDVAGGVSCRVNVQRGALDLEWRSGACDLPGFARRLKDFGYRVCPARKLDRSESRDVAWRLGLAAVFALNGMLYALPGYFGMERDFAFAPHFGWLAALFGTLSLWVGGRFFIVKAWRAARQGIAHLDLPISIGILFAYATSWYGFARGIESLVYFDFVSTFLFLMLLGRWLQVAAVERNRNRLADIRAAVPEVEIETDAGGRARASAEALRRGSTYWLASGARVPTRSILRSGEACLAMDWITGETESKRVGEGGEAASGASVESPFPIRLESREDWGDSLLAKLSQGEARTAERDRVAQKWIFRYLVVAFGVAVAGGVAWSVAAGLERGLMVFIAALVVSCPCALGLAWPFADETALARLQRSGVFVTTHTFWNRLGRVRRIVFDKTGTVTRSTLSLLNPEALDALDAEAARAASALCAESRHPVAAAVRERLMATGRLVRPTTGSGARERVGLGLEADCKSGVWRLGKASWAAPDAADAAATVLSRDGEIVAELRFGDHPFPGAAEEIAALLRRGFGVSILSGDRPEKAALVGALLGLAPGEAVGGMAPEAKRDWLRARHPEETLMVGDGANDLLAFGEASCCGAPANEQGIVAERADFHYLGSGIQGIRRLLDVARARRATMRALLAFAIGYNVFAVGLALAGWINPIWAAALMPLSSVASLGIVWLGLGLGTEKMRTKR